MAGRLAAELTAGRERPLPVAYPSLVVAARYEHVRVDGHVVSQGVLVVAGVRGDGHREILAVAVADTESAATDEALVRRLKARGLHGVELVTSDDHAGLRAAIARHVPGASWQRGQGHVARTVTGRVGRPHRARLGADLRGVFAAGSAAQARSLARACAAAWRAGQPPRAAMLEDEVADGLACYQAPASHRVRVRTTNGLERVNQERNRRTRVGRVFPNRDALLRRVTALARAHSDAWVSGRRYLDMDAGEAVMPVPATPIAAAA